MKCHDQIMVFYDISLCRQSAINRQIMIFSFVFIFFQRELKFYWFFFFFFINRYSHIKKNIPLFFFWRGGSSMDVWTDTPPPWLFKNRNIKCKLYWRFDNCMSYKLKFTACFVACKLVVKMCSNSSCRKSVKSRSNSWCIKGIRSVSNSFQKRS